MAAGAASTAAQGVGEPQQIGTGAGRAHPDRPVRLGLEEAVVAVDLA